MLSMALTDRHCDLPKKTAAQLTRPQVRERAAIKELVVRQALYSWSSKYTPAIATVPLALPVPTPQLRHVRDIKWAVYLVIPADKFQMTLSGIP